MRMKLMLTLGWMALGFGAIGIFIPVWPTTPFVLVAAGCFSGHPGLQKRIRQHEFFREYLDNYQHGGGVSAKTLGTSLVFLWGMLLVSALLVKKPWIWGILLLVGIGVTIHLLFMAKKKKK